MNINISGDMFLATVQAITGAKTFADSTLKLAGASSGTATLIAPAAAGSAVVTLPGVTSTLAILGANTFTALQTITQASANAGVLASTGYSLTGSDATSMVDLSGTWNTSGTPTLVKANVTNTASNAASLLLDLQVNGASVFKTKIDGSLFIASAAVIGLSTDVGLSRISAGVMAIGTGAAGSVSGTFEANRYWIGNAAAGAFSSSGLLLARSNNAVIGWAASNASGSIDTGFTAPAAATIQLGAADAASPVAQTIQAQGSRVGTDSNVGGGNLTIKSGLGTGTGTLSTLNFASPVAVASGTGAQTMTTAMTVYNGNVGIGTASPTQKLDINGNLSVFDQTASTGITKVIVKGGAGQTATDKLFDVQNSSGSSKFYVSLFSGNAGLVIGNGATDVLYWPDSSTFRFTSGQIIQWSSSSSPTGSADFFLFRAAAATLQLGNVAAASPIAQTLTFQGSRIGTDSNVAGPNATIQTAIGTGNATPSALIIKGVTAVGSGFSTQTVTEVARFDVPNGLTIASGLALKLGNAATTGLTAGVLAALTNASVTLVDSSGQTYRIPCII